MKVIHVAPSVGRSQGGPSRAVPLQILSLIRAGVKCDLVTQIENDIPTEEACLLTRRGVRIYQMPRHTITSILFPYSSKVKSLARMISDYDLVHIHGLWLPCCHAASNAAFQIALPVVVSPDGMLHPWALDRRWLKKRLAWFAYQRRDIARASLVHATADMEAEYIRKLCIRAPVAVVPNGTTIPAVVSHAWKSKSRQMLFLSRICTGKGLEDFLGVMAGHKALLASHEWKLVIAGYGEGGYLKSLKDLSSRLGLNDMVTFRGPVEGSAKWNLYRSSELFVLPSVSENFGMVVAEALACGVPVLTTRGTPWADVERYRCGWWVDVGAASLSDTLRRIVVLPRSILARMGSRGRELVRTRYSGDRLGRSLKAVYSWILHGGRKPSCVQLIR